MKVYEAVETMLAVRDYSAEPISDEELTSVLNAGRFTASRRNRQPWHFVVVRDKSLLNQVANLAPSGDYIRQAAAAVAVFVENDQVITMIDGAKAVQNMMLVAWGEGIGSNWVGGLQRNEIARLLGAPAEHRLLTVLSLGYPARPIGSVAKNRKALSEIVDLERYGHPFEL